MTRTSIRNHCIVAGIVLLLFGTGTVPVLSQPMTTESEPVPDFWENFGLISNVVVSWDANITEEPLIPRGEMRVVPLQVSFSITYGVFGRLVHFLLRYQFVHVKLSIVEMPEWCTAVLSQGTLSTLLPPDDDTSMTVTTYLIVAVGDQAPAFEICPVKIHLTVEPLHCLFGFVPLMQGSILDFQVTFVVGYKPLIQPQYPQGNVIETPPLVQVNLPIQIINLGNGKTIVENEIVNYLEGWVVSLPEQLILEIGETKEMNLSLIAPAGFSSEEVITVSYTPHSFEYYELVGGTLVANFLVYYHPPK